VKERGGSYRTYFVTAVCSRKFIHYSVGSSPSDAVVLGLRTGAQPPSLAKR